MSEIPLQSRRFRRALDSKGNRVVEGLEIVKTHVETLMIYKLGFNQNYYTFTLILLIKIVLCSKFP